MERFIDFLKSLFADGYKVVGISAPLLSISYTLAKALGSPALIDLEDLSYVWALLPVTVWFIIAYVRRWKYSKIIEGAMEPKLIVNWRSSKGNFAELMLMNTSSKTLPGIEVQLANYRHSDGSHITDVISAMTSVDGKTSPMKLDPGVWTYFRFANSFLTDQRGIRLLPGQEPVIMLPLKEVGVKFTVSGENIPGCTVSLRVRLNDDKSFSLEAWEKGKDAVGSALSA